MARFGVYRNPSGTGYLLDLQADLLDYMTTRVVVPLLPFDKAPKPAKTLNPVFEVEGVQVVMVTQAMAAVPVQLLKGKILSLEPQRNDITAALDLLFHGF
jgi:toxin CcdB